MADSDLPVFSFRANWKEPLSERLGFLTDVLRASGGAEQRRSVRETPRRTLETDFLLSGPERTFWDLFIDRLGGGEFTAPLYWEVVALQNSLMALSGDRIDFDTTSREWQYCVGGLAILSGESALSYEVVEIAAVDAGGVDLAAPVIRPWPVGTKLMPLRRAVFDSVGGLNHKTAGTATVSAQIRFVGPQPWEPAADAAPTYLGLPVLRDEPNWVEDLTVQFDREVDVLDTGVGATYQVDPLGRTLLGQSHRWFLPGREKLAAFRDLIYRHRGRAGAFWLPTFKADLRLAAAAGSGATQITVDNVGFVYTGGPSSGREYIAIKHAGGTILRKITSAITGLTSATERLNLDAPLGLALSPGQDLRIGFADTARFDSDEFEIVHYGGVDAHHETSGMFRAIKNTRSSPEPIDYPITPGVMTDAPCGIAPTEVFDVNLPGNSSGTTADAADSYDIVLLPGQTLTLTKPAGLTYEAWSFTPSDDFISGTYGPNKWTNGFSVENGEGAVTHHWGEGDVNVDGTHVPGETTPIREWYPNADAAFDSIEGRSVVLTGSLLYRIYLHDATSDDNRGGLSLRATVTST